MRDSDRFWWAHLILGLAFCFASVAFPWYLLYKFPPGGPYSTHSGDAQTTGMAALIGLLSLGVGVMIIVQAAHTRGRHRKRLAAFYGDLAAMPFATIQPDPSEAPDVATQPLELMWRVNRGQSAVYVIGAALPIFGGLFSIGASLIVLIGPMSTLPQVVEQYRFIQTPSAPMSLNEIVIRIALACGVIALAVGGGFWLARMFPFLAGRPFGVRATAEGIEGSTEFGSHVHITWSEVILFEVSGAKGYAVRVFALYALGKCVKWSEYWTGDSSDSPSSPRRRTSRRNALSRGFTRRAPPAGRPLPPRRPGGQHQRHQRDQQRQPGPPG